MIVKMSCRSANLFLSLIAVLSFACLHQVMAEDPYRPPIDAFANPALAKAYRGELVFVDHVNRRGSLRLHVDGHFQEGKLHHFAMLPYGMIWYRGAPAELKDIPLGTILYGRFYQAPDPKISAVPISNGSDVTAPAENHAVLLEDGPSLCLREEKGWNLKTLKIQGSEGELVASLEQSPSEEGLVGEHTLTLDGSTRIWRGRELLGIDDLISEGQWPETGTLDLKGASVQLSLAWHPRYLYQQFHIADLWLDEEAMAVATERQRQRHIRHIKTRWMPARVDSVEYGKFGQAVVRATLFGGMATSLYEDFQPNIGAKMAAAENTLRTWWPDHDGMDGKIIAVEKISGELAPGDSGIRVEFEVPLILEGFRPGRIVRVRPHRWPNVKPPVEECVRSFEDRWPSPDIFKRN
jgi:hypothetical protein